MVTEPVIYAKAHLLYYSSTLGTIEDRTSNANNLFFLLKGNWIKKKRRNRAKSPQKTRKEQQGKDYKKC